jgi:hypothetical protein
MENKALRCTTLPHDWAFNCVLNPKSVLWSICYRRFHEYIAVSAFKLINTHKMAQALDFVLFKSYIIQ